MRGRKILVRLLAVVVGSVVAIYAAEALVYLLDPFGAPTQARNGRLYQEALVQLDLTSPRLFRHRQNASVTMRGHLFRTDSRGLRGPEREHPKPPERKRLLFLGDSVVLGWGVAEKDSFIQLVDDALDGATGEAWETINAGHLLHDTTQELAVLEEVGFSYEPDVLVLVFVENDVVSTRSVFELGETGPSETASEEAQRVLRTVRRLTTIKPYLPNLHALLEFVLVRASPAGQQGSAEHAQELGLSLEEGWEASQAALRRMHELAGERGVRFGVFDYRRDNELSSRLAAFCAVEGIPYRSIAFTAEEEALDIENSAADAHANPLGHELLAAHILEALRDTGLVDGMN